MLKSSSPLWDGVNLYAYVGGNPISRIDPSGKIALVDDAVILASVAVAGYLIWDAGQQQRGGNPLHNLGINYPNGSGNFSGGGPKLNPFNFGGALVVGGLVHKGYQAAKKYLSSRK